jgi:hypothetical protein
VGRSQVYILCLNFLIYLVICLAKRTLPNPSLAGGSLQHVSLAAGIDTISSFQKSLGLSVGDLQPQFPSPPPPPPPLVPRTRKPTCAIQYWLYRRCCRRSSLPLPGASPVRAPVLQVTWFPSPRRAFLLHTFLLFDSVQHA